MHYPKTVLRCHKKKPQNLASACMHSRTMALFASKGLVSHADVRLVVCSCLRANVWDWLAPSLSNDDSGSIFRWHLNNDAAFRIPSFESTFCR